MQFDVFWFRVLESNMWGCGKISVLDGWFWDVLGLEVQYQGSLALASQQKRSAGCLHEQ